MTRRNDETFSLKRRAKAFLIASGIVLIVLVADILAAKVQVMAGASNPLHLGDTMQFILLLAAVVLFVISALHHEILAGGRNGTAMSGGRARPREQRIQQDHEGGNVDA